MNGRLENKIVYIAGAGRGIGRTDCLGRSSRNRYNLACEQLHSLGNYNVRVVSIYTN
jgi:hypothetical protein